MNLSTSEFDSEFDLAKNYLLHRLDETTREKVAYRLLDESDFEQLLDSVAEDLLFDYAQEALPHADKIALEEHYLMLPEHRAQLTKVQHLLATLATTPALRPLAHRAASPAATISPAAPPPNSRGPRWSLSTRRMPVYALLLFLILAAGCALTWHFRRAAEAEALLALINQQPEQYLAQQPQAFATATLKPVSRGETSDQNQIPAVSFSPAHYLLLRVPAPEGTYQSYDVTARRSDNSIRLTRNRLSLSDPNGKRQVIAVFPVAKLSAGDYEIILDGVTNEGLSKNLNKSSLRLFP